MGRPVRPRVTCRSRLKRNHIAGFCVCVTKLATVFETVYIKKKAHSAAVGAACPRSAVWQHQGFISF